MSRPLRLEHEGALWHITSRGNERRNIFRSDADRRKFLELLENTVRRFRWLVRAWTLMTNHYHLVIETPECTLSRDMHWLNGGYVKYFNRKYRRVGHLFQGRYKSILVEKEEYLNEVIRYTELNAVRAGMVAHPREYRWSSYRAHAGYEPIPDWLASDWLFALDPDPKAAQAIYREFIDEKLSSTESLWDKLEGQFYLGTAGWIEKMRKRVESKPRSDEHSKAQRLLPRKTMVEVIRSVARAFGVNPNAIRKGRGGAARMLSAWIGWQGAILELRPIAAALLLRSAGHVSNLVRKCERELARDKLLQQFACAAIDDLRVTV